MTTDAITNLLSLMTLGDNRSPGTLRRLAFAIGGTIHQTAKYAKKEIVVSLLTDYFLAPNRFEQLWDSLDNAERKIVSLHIWGNGNEPPSYADEVAKEFGIPKNKDKHSYYYGENGMVRYRNLYAKDNSALWLLFFDQYTANNSIFQEQLRSAVGDLKRIYEKPAQDYDFVSRESRTSEFANIVKLCNTSKVAVTRTGMLTKAAALKLLDFCGYEDYALNIDAEPKDMRTVQGFIVTFPLTVLGCISGLLATLDGACIPGGKALTFLSLPYHQLIKKLYEAYLKSNSFDEILLIPKLKAARGHHPRDARENLVCELKYCPIGQPIETKEFERYLRIAAHDFARKKYEHVIETTTYDYGYTIDWDRYEHLLIHIVLSFFGALGMIDIAWGEDWVKPNYDFDDFDRRAPVAFRINPLGAFVLGLSDTYTPSVPPEIHINGGFIVLPDYTVVIPDSNDRIKHEMYFEKLLSKVSDTDEATIYKLDFSTIVRVIDSNSTIAELRNYLSFSDKPLPENVAQALDDWERQTGRIKLRQVTILECEDEALLEEVIRYKGMDKFVKEKIHPAAVIDGDRMKEIKKTIEKNKRFCIIE